jgi:acyl-CoA oxidase
MIIHDPRDQELRRQLADLFRHEIFAARSGLTYEEKCRLTYERLRYLGRHVPPGTELLRDPRRLFTVMEWGALASPSLFVAMTIHYCLCLGPLVEFGADRDDLAGHLEALDSMASIGTILVTEVGRGNSHVDLRTRVTYDAARREFTVDTPDAAAQKFMPNVGLAGVPKLGVLYAPLTVAGEGRGVFPFVVRLRDENGPLPGVRITSLPESLFLPLDHALIAFDQVRLPESSLLNDTATLRPAFHDPLGDPERRLQRSLTVRQNAWAACASALAAVTRASVAIAIRYSHRRLTRTAGSLPVPVIRYRSQQRGLFGGLARAYAITSLANRAKAIRADAIAGRASAEALVNRTLGLTKALAVRTAERVASECRRRCGAQGAFSANRIAEYQGLGHALSAAAGDDHLILLGAGRTLSAGLDYEPPAAGAPGGDLSEPSSWLALARTRERQLHQELVQGLASAGGSAEAWNDHLGLASDLAWAHAERLALESLLADAASGPERAGLDSLCALYALEEIERHAGWYLSHELLDPGQVRALPAAIDACCERILPQALGLVDAFEIPADLLGAPIVEADYVAALTDVASRAPSTERRA